MTHQTDVPVVLKPILSDFTFYVLKNKPTDVIQFAAEYFNRLNFEDKLRSSGRKSGSLSGESIAELPQSTAALAAMLAATNAAYLGTNRQADARRLDNGVGRVYLQATTGGSGDATNCHTPSIESSSRPGSGVNFSNETVSADAIIPEIVTVETVSGTAINDERGDDDNDDDDEEEDDDILHDMSSRLLTRSPAYNVRRQSVAAESFDPEKEEHTQVTVIPKKNDQWQRLSNVLKQIFIFRSLEEEQMRQVIDAMFEQIVQCDDEIIKQGDDGDFFYVIESGRYDILVNDALVGTYDGSGSFGELALMYNTPRAATIVARTTGGILWAMDRTTFRQIVLKQAFLKRRLYEELLRAVPLLVCLSTYERASLADALVSRVYADGERIIAQNEPGEEMFFVEDGEVRITVSAQNGEEKELKRLSKQGYFGELALITKQPRQASAYAIGRTRLAVLDVSSFERLMGPCVDLMKREAACYRDQMVEILGEEALLSHPELARLAEELSATK